MTANLWQMQQKYRYELLLINSRNGIAGTCRGCLLTHSHQPGLVNEVWWRPEYSVQEVPAWQWPVQWTVQRWHSEASVKQWQSQTSLQQRHSQARQRKPAAMMTQRTESSPFGQLPKWLVNQVRSRHPGVHGVSQPQRHRRQKCLPRVRLRKSNRQSCCCGVHRCVWCSLTISSCMLWFGELN